MQEKVCLNERPLGAIFQALISRVFSGGGGRKADQDGAISTTLSYEACASTAMVVTLGVRLHERKGSENDREPEGGQGGEGPAGAQQAVIEQGFA